MDVSQTLAVQYRYAAVRPADAAPLLEIVSPAMRRVSPAVFARRLRAAALWDYIPNRQDRTAR